MQAYYSEIVYTATASTAAVGYPASNLALHSIGRPWRSTVTTATTITLDIGSSKTPAGLLIQDCNFTAAAVDTSPDNATWTAAPSLAPAADGLGRYKDSIALGAACRYIRISIPSGTPTDGAAYFRIGSAYLFLSASTFSAPDYGLRLGYQYPQARADLPNGIAVSVAVGNAYTILEGRVSGGPNDDIAALSRLARAGVVGIDFALPDHPWMTFPVEHKEKSVDQVAQDYGYWPTDITLREVV